MQTLIGLIKKRIVTQHRENGASKRLRTIPGIGIIGATAIADTVTDPKAFRSGRDFAAWIGLVPRQDSTGGKQKLGPISKQGDRYLRRILVVGAHSVLRRAKLNPQKHPWLTQLLAGTDQRITSGPAATAAASRQRQSSKRKQAGYMAAPERFAETSDSSCTAGAVHTWPVSTVRGSAVIRPESKDKPT